MFPSILELVKSVFGFAKERIEAKHLRNIAAIKEQQRQIEDREIRTHAWDLAQLNDKDKVLRIMAFVLFASPLLAYLISPKLGDYVQKAWSSISAAQANVLYAMCLAVFGRQHIPNMIGSIVSSVSKGLRK